MCRNLPGGDELMETGFKKRRYFLKSRNLPGGDELMETPSLLAKVSSAAISSRNLPGGDELMET